MSITCRSLCLIKMAWDNSPKNCSFILLICSVSLVHPQSHCTKSTAPPSSPRRSGARQFAATSAKPAWTLPWIGRPVAQGRGLGMGSPGVVQCPHLGRAPYGKTCQLSGTVGFWSSWLRSSASTKRWARRRRGREWCAAERLHKEKSMIRGVEEQEGLDQVFNPTIKSMQCFIQVHFASVYHSLLSYRIDLPPAGW